MSVSFLAYTSIPMTKTARLSETSVNFYRTTQRHKCGIQNSSCSPLRELRIQLVSVFPCSSSSDVSYFKFLESRNFRHLALVGLNDKRAHRSCYYRDVVNRTRNRFNAEQRRITHKSEKTANFRRQVSATFMGRCRAADYIHISRNVTSPIPDCRGCNNATRGGERCQRLELIPKTNHQTLQVTIPQSRGLWRVSKRDWNIRTGVSCKCQNDDRLHCLKLNQPSGGGA
jgi:hypothetical protein